MASSADETNDFVERMQAWHAQTIGEQTVKALRRNNFDAHYVKDQHELYAYLKPLIQPGTKVAFGGSQTLKQLGIPELVTGAGGVILDHNAPGLTPDEKMKVMRQQQVCDVFMSSSNAISMEGFFYNVDGNGNRVSAMVFGPGKVIVIAGVNKICSDEAAAWERIRSIAAPVNMKRLNRDTPCTVHGTCQECRVPDRGCNAYLELKRKPSLTDFSVFIVGQKLGF